LKKKNRVYGVCFLLVTASIFLLPAITLARVNEDPGPEFNSGQWIWALFSLVIVVALAYWATKFLAGKFGVSGAKHLKVAESLFLGPNRHLYLLLVNHKVILIGSTEHGINLLQEIDDPEFYTELERSAEKNQTLPVDKFSSLIGPILKGLNPRGVNDSDVTDTKQRLQNGLAKIRSWKTRGRDQ
jgi:flagellar biogenesis protein FliO